MLNLFAIIGVREKRRRRKRFEEPMSLIRGKTKPVLKDNT